MEHFGFAKFLGAAGVKVFCVLCIQKKTIHPTHV